MYNIIDKLQKESEKEDIYLLGGIIKVSNRKIEQIYYIDEIPESIINKLRFRIIGSNEFKTYLSKEEISIKDLNYIRCENGLKTIQYLLDIVHLDKWFSLVEKSLDLKFRYSDEKEEKAIYVYLPNKLFSNLEEHVGDYVIDSLFRKSKEDEIFLFGGAIKVKNKKFYCLKSIDILFFEQSENSTLSHYYKDDFSKKMLECLKVKIKDLKYFKISNESAIDIIKKLSLEKRHINRLRKLKNFLYDEIKYNKRNKFFFKLSFNIKNIFNFSSSKEKSKYLR
jgi:hypothetical protein